MVQIYDRLVKKKHFTTISERKKIILKPDFFTFPENYIKLVIGVGRSLLFGHIPLTVIFVIINLL